MLTISFKPLCLVLRPSMKCKSLYFEVTYDLLDISGQSETNEHSNRLWKIFEDWKINGSAVTFIT